MKIWINWELRLDYSFGKIISYHLTIKSKYSILVTIFNTIGLSAISKIVNFTLRRVI